MNILRVRITEPIHSLFVHCGLWCSLPLLACFAITVFPVIRRSYSLMKWYFAFPRDVSLEDLWYMFTDGRGSWGRFDTVSTLTITSKGVFNTHSFFSVDNHNLKSTWKNSLLETIVCKSDPLSQTPAYTRVNNQIWIGSGATCSWILRMFKVEII